MKRFLVHILYGSLTFLHSSCADYDLFFPFSNPLPYPSLKEQRAALSAKPNIPSIRLLDSLQIMEDLEYLASDTCEGRKGGSAGHQNAVNRILFRMRAAGLDSFENSLIQKFSSDGKNVIGSIKGTVYPYQYIVLSAHYDHLGKNVWGKTYYGADDNASGVACLLALARYFGQHPHPYSLIFAAFDKEEAGLKGAYAYVNRLKQENKLAAVKFNLNMDMIARSDSNEIFACGIRQYPAFKYVVDSVQHKTNVKLLMGHDGGTSGENWTSSSDHGAFHSQQIPFLYIGVEDHKDYHKITDTYSRVDYSRYLENCNLVLSMIQVVHP